MSRAESSLGESDGPAPGEVRVFVADARAFGADAARLAQSLAWMAPGERARFNRFRHEDDRLMFALGRFMARTLVGRALGLDPPAWIWREGPHGRPEIDGPDTGLHFNLSHSAGLVICALARGQAVGVDVEDLARRAPEWALVERYCSPAEADDIRVHGDRWHERFLTYWTLKEAYLKARGLGISVPLADITFTLGPDGARIGFERALAGTDDRWAFHLWQPAARYLAAVAARVDGANRPAFTVAAF
jgi:4'-phosphopantetheinyl transferase